ncbi:unnamed protein product [Zymoseptoria tritici ST99CH_1A5]|uniref:Uncharacterized protein n=1 Tax=Zymoseptoria tritici ST99CH_1A5 TaxID=1276529 RepID=A0A1Y6M1C6_ZYMTR|nr:unnamed protein product [Zymoseptoria tritici ST99CH_1A5]
MDSVTASPGGVPCRRGYLEYQVVTASPKCVSCRQGYLECQVVVDSIERNRCLHCLKEKKYCYGARTQEVRDIPNESVGRPDDRRPLPSHQTSIPPGHSLHPYNGPQTTSESLVPYIVPTRPPSLPAPIVHQTAVSEDRPLQGLHRLPPIWEVLSKVPAYFAPAPAGQGNLRG